MRDDPVLKTSETTPALHLPVWARAARPQSVAEVAFRSGAVLAVLDGLLTDPARGVPVRLLAHRHALLTAASVSKLEGRLSRLEDIRDAYHLTQPGAARGPDGDALAFWRGAVRLRLKRTGWQGEVADLMDAFPQDQVTQWIAEALEVAGLRGPLAGCVAIMRMVLAVDNRAERAACLLADLVLARVLRWQVILPVAALEMSSSALRALVAQGPDAELAVQVRLLGALQDTIGRAQDLAGRAAALQAVAPKLRSKGSDAAVALFLAEDAVAPATVLSPLIQGSDVAMTDRAARRFCDRLVALGVAHELTGRPTFRLYGIAP